MGIYDNEVPQEAWRTIQVDDDFKRLKQMMPELHPAYIGFCLSNPHVDASVPIPKDIEGWRKKYEQMKVKGIDGISEIDRINSVLSGAFDGCDFEATAIDGYDFSPSNMELVITEAERLLSEAEQADSPEEAKEKEELSDKYRRIADAQEFSLNFLPVGKTRQQP